MRYSLKTVTVLSYFPRLRTRSISPEIYKLRVIEVNNFLQDSCKNHQLTFWGLRGFTESKHEVFCDCVHLNLLCLLLLDKLIKQHSGILLRLHCISP